MIDLIIDSLGFCKDGHPSLLTNPEILQTLKTTFKYYYNAIRTHSNRTFRIS